MDRTEQILFDLLKAEQAKKIAPDPGQNELMVLGEAFVYIASGYVEAAEKARRNG